MNHCSVSPSAASLAGSMLPVMQYRAKLNGDRVEPLLLVVGIHSADIAGQHVLGGGEGGCDGARQSARERAACSACPAGFRPRSASPSGAACAPRPRAFLADAVAFGGLLLGRQLQGSCRWETRCFPHADHIDHLMQFLQGFVVFGLPHSLQAQDDLVQHLVAQRIFGAS